MAIQNQDVEYIDIDKDLIPYTFDITLNGRSYQFGINYNSLGDFFTADLNYNNERLVTGEKILLNQILFYQIAEDLNGNLNEKFPKDLIMAQSTNNKVGKMGWNELGENCFLYVLSR